MHVFRKLHLPPGISPLDIHVLSPLDERLGGMSIHVESMSRGLELRNYGFNGRRVLHAVIYRLVLERPRDASDRFDDRVRQLMAA